jgi:DNA-directed RNA polymerase specialized sigma24 family protein
VDKKQTRDFEGFVAESGDALLRMATLLTSDVHRAEDVYQETLHRLAARWARVESPMAFCRRRCVSRSGPDQSRVVGDQAGLGAVGAAQLVQHP